LEECKSSVKIINLNNNELNDDCIESFGEFIQNNQTIKDIIYISDNKITDKGIEILLPCLIGNITIKYLVIYGNKGITDKSVSLLIEIIQKSSVENMNLDYTSITKEGREEIKSSLSIPIDKREIPLITIGNVKSASKIS